MKQTFGAFLLILMAWSGSAAAEKTEPSIFDLLAGEWISDGDAFGRPASTTMHWAPSLGGKFVQLDYKIVMQVGDDATSNFEGVAYYRDLEGDQFKAFWADNAGDLHPITAERDGSALIAHWGVEGGKQGRTRYELTASGDIAVTDWIKTDEGWRQFNHNIFVRASE